MDVEKSLVIGDTGFVVVLLNRNDIKHQDVVRIYSQYPKIILPQTVLTEVAYLVG